MKKSIKKISNISLAKSQSLAVSHSSRFGHWLMVMGKKIPKTKDYKTILAAQANN